MNPFICLIQPAQNRDYSTPSDKKGLIDQNPPQARTARPLLRIASELLHVRTRLARVRVLGVLFGSRNSFLIAGMVNDAATIKDSTNENNTDVDRWADARRLRINGKSRSKPWRCLNLPRVRSP